MFKFTIENINGKIYRVFSNGRRLPVIEHRFHYLPTIAATYILTDLVSGKQYIGSTVNLRNRAGNYVSKSKKDMRGLFKLLDSNQIDIKLLDDCKYLTTKQRLELELSRILEYKTLYPQGLNIKCPITLKNLVKLPSKVKVKQKVIKSPKEKKVISKRIPKAIVPGNIFIKSRYKSKKNSNVLRDY